MPPSITAAGSPVTRDSGYVAGPNRTDPTWEHLVTQKTAPTAPPQRPVPLGFSDRPTRSAQQDLLEVKYYGQALADFVTNCRTPMTVGVQGEWGSGKSSLLGMLQEELGKPSRVAKPFYTQDWERKNRGRGHVYVGPTGQEVARADGTPVQDGDVVARPAFLVGFEVWQFGIVDPRSSACACSRC